MLAKLAAAVFAGVTTALVPTTWNGRAYDCKCYPGDACWPKTQEWSALNTTLNGNLAIHVPPGAACHSTLQGPLGNITTYNEAGCSSARANFNSAQWT